MLYIGSYPPPPTLGVVSESRYQSLYWRLLLSLSIVTPFISIEKLNIQTRDEWERDWDWERERKYVGSLHCHCTFLCWKCVLELGLQISNLRIFRSFWGLGSDNISYEVALHILPHCFVLIICQKHVHVYQISAKYIPAFMLWFIYFVPLPWQIYAHVVCLVAMWWTAYMYRNEKFGDLLM